MIENQEGKFFLVYSIILVIEIFLKSRK